MIRLILIITAFFICRYLPAQQSEDKPPIIFIYDASGSMWGQIDGKTKIEIATVVLTNAVNNFETKQRIGLVAYGHRKEGDCKDVEFLNTIENRDKSAIIKSLKSIKPLGRTPLAYSASEVIDRLRSSQNKATIILITDGIESCGGNICEIVKKAKEEGIDFRLHIIGFGLNENETDQLICAATAGEGKYFDAGNADQLGSVLDEATNQTVEELAYNISVYATKNGKPVDALVKAYPAGSTTYSISVRTYSDTGFMHLPVGSYNLQFTALSQSDVEPITVNNVNIPDKGLIHKSISFDAGNLEVYTSNNGEDWDAVISIYNHQTGIKVTGSRTYGQSKSFELNPGSYDVEVQAMALEGSNTKNKQENFIVKANETTKMSYNFESGIAMIGALNGTDKIDVVVSIVDLKTNKNIAGGRTYTQATSNPKKFLLNPGSYEVTLKGLQKFSGVNKSFKIEISAGTTLEKITNF